MTGQEQYTKPRQRFSSGRELITAVKTRREEAQRFKALSQDVESELAGELDQYDPELTQGVRVLWIREGRAARDETAFRHALKIAHRLRQSGQRMTDAAIIDAYEQAYAVAQEVGSDGRKLELPPMRDRQTMARRVRGYVTQAKTHGYVSASGGSQATATERKALATMGRRGGKKAAERWKDPNSDYAQAELEKLKKTHRVNRAKGRSTRSKVEQLVNDYYIQTGRVPSRKEVMADLGLSEATVKRHLRALKNDGLFPS